MVNVGWNDHPPTGYFIAHQFGRDLLPVGHVAHLFGDHTLARIVHLREVAVGVRPPALGEPLGARLRNMLGTMGDVIAVAVLTVLTVLGGHDGLTFTGSHQQIIPVSGHSRAPATAFAWRTQPWCNPRGLACECCPSRS